MRFEENKAAGWGVREFRNVEPPKEGRRPGGDALEWCSKVVQRGTMASTGRIEGVTVHYHRGRRRTFRGEQANRILRDIQAARADAVERPTMAYWRTQGAL